MKKYVCIYIILNTFIMCKVYIYIHIHIISVNRGDLKRSPANMMFSLWSIPKWPYRVLFFQHHRCLGSFVLAVFVRSFKGRSFIFWGFGHADTVSYAGPGPAGIQPQWVLPVVFLGKHRQGCEIHDTSLVDMARPWELGSTKRTTVSWGQAILELNLVKELT
jgi:hypothetical protein